MWNLLQLILQGHDCSDNCSITSALHFIMTYWTVAPQTKALKMFLYA
jgi:hypothetical protein